jgi:hypothetical protein
MIPLVVFRNPFLSWVLVSALLYSGLFWAYYSGLITYVIAADFTYIALALLLVLVYCNLSLGWMSHRLQQMIADEYEDEEDSSYFYTLFDTIGLWMFIAPSLGLLGTVIGLSHIMKESATVDIDSIVTLLGTGTGSALFPTAMGLVLTIILQFQRFIVMHSFRVHGFAQSV